MKLAAVVAFSLCAMPVLAHQPGDARQTADDLIHSPINEIKPPPGVQILFSPQHNIEAAVVRAMALAKREILFSQYALTNPRIAEALANARRRGVVVQGILEPFPAIENYVTPRVMAQMSIPILYPKERGWNNHKFTVIDRETVITGSFDWTRSANDNADNCLVVTEASFAAAYYNAWVAQARRSATFGATFDDETPQKPRISR